MPSIHQSAVTLRFVGNDLDPDEITRRLGSQPTMGARKGGTWRTLQGTDAMSYSGQWRLKAGRRSPGDVDGQITQLLAGLTPDLAVWKDLSGRFQADLFCGLFMDGSNEGLSLSPETLTAIGLRGLVLGLDIYGPDDPD